LHPHAGQLNGTSAAVLLPLLATALALGSLFIPNVGTRYPLWAQLLARAVLFAALTVLVQAILTSP
jgi:hypothetical protein